MKARLLLLIFALFTALSSPVVAVEPSEILKNPVLEARACEISKGLRCLVCRNEDIDESDAALAHDLRVLVRKRLVAGDTNQQVVQYIVARYGEFVLLKPRMNGSNLILWFSAPAMLLLGILVAVFYLRRRSRDARPDERLSEEEERALSEILKE